jgi:hypothetical protein
VGPDLLVTTNLQTSPLGFHSVFDSACPQALVAAASRTNKFNINKAPAWEGKRPQSHWASNIGGFRPALRTILSGMPFPLRAARSDDQVQSPSPSRGLPDFIRCLISSEAFSTQKACDPPALLSWARRAGSHGRSVTPKPIFSVERCGYEVLGRQFWVPRGGIRPYLDWAALFRPGWRSAPVRPRPPPRAAFRASL